MYKQRRKIFQVTTFFWIVYFTAIFSFVYPAMQDIVANVCVDFYREKAERIGIDFPQSTLFESPKIPRSSDEVKMPPAEETPEIQETPSLAPSEEISSLEEQESMQEMEETLPEEAETEEILPVSLIDSRLPGVVYLHINADLPEAPIILAEERISEEDVLADISNVIDSNLKYAVTAELELCISKIVYREAGTQSFLGKLLVAEGLVNRIRSGVYGNNIPAILKQGGYGTEVDQNGVYHVYYSNGTEVINIPEDAAIAARIALQGSKVSNAILEAGTNIRNQQYGLNLGEECYRYGSIYHFNPDLVSQKALNARKINRVPVSFHYMDHVFYGYWLNAKQALNIV